MMCSAQALTECCLICYAVLCRQCSSGLQAIADVAAAIKAGFYTVGLAAGGFLSAVHTSSCTCVTSMCHQRGHVCADMS
jgi:hypothetical protein